VQQLKIYLRVEIADRIMKHTFTAIIKQDRMVDWLGGRDSRCEFPGQTPPNSGKTCVRLSKKRWNSTAPTPCRLPRAITKKSRSWCETPRADPASHAHGCVLIREGKNHSWWGNPSKNLRPAVPRHTESMSSSPQNLPHLGLPSRRRADEWPRSGSETTANYTQAVRVRTPSSQLML